ncbi:MAG: HEPN family nuclease [Chloroflexota bacterium]|nr:HEPN family nuclease [Chloroflexota bacterium]
MSLTEQQHIDLVVRTLKNLTFIYANTAPSIKQPCFGLLNNDGTQSDEQIAKTLSKADGSRVWEVTQIINSFLGIVAHPRERLLDTKKIKWMSLTHPKVVKAGVPAMTSSWEFDSEEPRTLAQLLRLLRNGIAHGNIELLGVRELVNYRKDFRPDPGFDPTEIAGIEIWNSDNNQNRTWGTVLTVDELAAALNGFALLALDPDLHSSNQAPKNGGRKDPPPDALLERKPGRR